MNRVIFLVDGFNVYHSLLDAIRDLGGASTKWLDIHSLCNSYLPHISRDATIGGIYYFSAYAEHLRRKDPGKIERHEKYIQCLRSTGVVDCLGNFKERHFWCSQCKQRRTRHDEKETDVAIAAKLFEVFFKNECETAVLMTGDTDLVPAVKTALHLFPAKKIISIFPYLRQNDELEKLVHAHFKIKANKYLTHQLPNPVTLPNGKRIAKPTMW